MSCAFLLVITFLLTIAKTSQPECVQLKLGRVCFPESSVLNQLNGRPLDLNTQIAVKTLWKAENRLALSIAVTTQRQLSKGWQMNFSLALAPDKPVTVLQLNGLRFIQTGPRVIIGNRIRSYYGIVYDDGFFQFTVECLLPPSVNTSAIIQADRIVRDLQFTVLDRPGSSAFDGVSSTFTFHLHIREIKMAANGSLPGGENQFTAAVNIGVGLFIQVSEWTIEWQWLDETIVIESISPPASLFTQQQTVVKLSGQNLPSSADNAAIIQGRFKYGLQQPQGVRLSINGQPAQPILAENIVID